MKFRVLITSLILVASLAFAEEKQTSEQLYQEAYENFVKRDYVNASAALDKINPVDQKKADILNLRGAIYKRLGELDNAANAYSDALKVNPKDWVPKYNLAEVNFLREQYKSSRSFLEQALASMPEADRLQKQDLILYKVYLTYLLQGDDEKAKLLLDSFDMNSSNPVYYFAQAAWSFKKKDTDKAKTWVNSTEGLYSQDLRNSFGQALVDVGWLEPSAGVGAAGLTASPAPSATPDVAAASPTATPAPNTAAIVPLATNNATPIAVAAVTPTPVETPNEVATPAGTAPDLSKIAEKPAETKDSGSNLTWALIILIIIVVVAFILMNLAKKSRIVPPPEDNTGYDAIVASGNPENAGAIAYTSEGTGPVLEQDENGEVAPATIKISPIHREYAEDNAAAATTSFTEPEPAPVRITRRLSAVNTQAAAPKSKPSPKSVVTTKAKAPAPTKNKPTKTADKPTIAVPVTKQAASKPATGKAKAAQSSAKAKPSAPAPAAPAPSKVASKPATKSNLKTPAAKTTSKPVVSSSAEEPRRTRLIPVPTQNVPAPDVAPAKLLVSNIPVIKADALKTKTTAKPKAAAKPKTSAKPAATKSVAPLITIPEFEDSNLDSDSSPVIRLVPEAAPSKEQQENA